MPVLLSGKSGFENQNQNITKTPAFINYFFLLMFLSYKSFTFILTFNLKIFTLYKTDKKGRP